MSGFSSLNVGTQALFAAQRALDVTGQNVSNVNTEGYSRQRIHQLARGAPVVPAMWSRSDASSGGVDVTGTQRIRDNFLELRAQQEHASYSSLTTLSKTYADLESTFGEPSETGLQSQLSTFWTSWQDVANNPGDPGPAALMLEQAGTVAGKVNSFANQLGAQWEATRSDATSTVQQVNSMTAEVARLNAAIRTANLNGSSPNELADQRDLLVLTIAKATGAVASDGENGVVNLTLAGRSLVSSDRSSDLQVDGPTSYPGASGTIGLSWSATGQPATVTSGVLSAQLAAVNATIPSAMADLDSVVTALVRTVNAQQAAGFDGAGGPGAPIFAGTTAATFSVVMSDPSGVATSAQAPPVRDGDNALAMSSHAGDAGGPDELFQQMMIRLGVQAQSVQRHADTQQAVVTRVDDDRQNASGVSLDEEMTNLVQFQHAYSAAAKYISAIDSTLDTLINMVR